MSRREGYIFDDRQSAKIEQLRFAIRGLSQIAHDGDMRNRGTIEIDRPYFAAIMELLDDRLGELIGLDKVTHVWLDPEPEK